MRPSKYQSQLQSINPLPFEYYFIPYLAIALIGLADSIYLAISHYRVHTDLNYSSFCALSQAFNCDTVSASPYAVFLGIPLGIWGIIGYALVIALLVAAGSRQHGRKRLWPLLFWTGLLYSVGSLVLAWISSTIIQSYCIMCILTYVVNFLLLYYAWFVNRRFGDVGLLKGLARDMQMLWQQRKMSLPIVGLFVFTTAGFAMGIPSYWQMTPPALSDAVNSGITDDGHPWIGAQNPSLTITEFSDYMCFQCKKMHFFLRKLVQLNPDHIRLVHRHFPMDNAYNPLVPDRFHAGAGNMAIIALYANEKGKFWEVNDLLFGLAEKKADFNTKIISQQVGISNRELSAALKSKSLRLRLKHDIAVGIKYGIDGTPAFIIDEMVHVGRIPPEILETYLK